MQKLSYEIGGVFFLLAMTLGIIGVRASAQHSVITEISGRVTAIELETRTARLATESRLVKLETIVGQQQSALERQQSVFWGIFSTVAVQIALTAWVVIFNPRSRPRKTRTQE